MVWNKIHRAVPNHTNRAGKIGFSNEPKTLRTAPENGNPPNRQRMPDMMDVTMFWIERSVLRKTYQPALANRAESVIQEAIDSVIDISICIVIILLFLPPYRG